MRRPLTTLASLVSIAVLVVAVGCTSDDGDDAAEGDDTTSTAPTATEDPRLECNDPTGDLEDINAAPGSTSLTQPAGVDIFSGVAEVTDDEVEITMTMAGDIETKTADPVYVVFRGVQAAQQGSFELQVRRGPEGTWTLFLVDYLTNRGAETQLDLPVDVNAETLSFTVPLDRLPPLSATRLWAFGTSDGDTEAGLTEVSDLCAPFEADTPTTTAG